MKDSAKTWLTLYRYELKKILQKRFTLAALFAVYAVIVLGTFTGKMGKAYINDVPYTTNAELLKLDKANALALSGREIDDALLGETLGAYREFQSFADSFGPLPSAEEKQRIADAHIALNRPYKPVFDFCAKALKKSTNELLFWEGGEEAFRSGVAKNLQNQFELSRLSEGEAGFWRQKREQCGEPLVFQYCAPYSNLISFVYAASALIVLVLAVALSGVFSEEYALRCDQLIFSSRNGLGALYSAKIAAGLTFALAAGLGLDAAACSAVFAVYGREGFGAALQLYQPLYPYPVSIGRFTFIAGGVMLLAILVVSAFIMLLSVCFRRSIAPAAIVLVWVMLGMFLPLPKNLRPLSQIWNWLPVNYLFAGTFFDLRLFRIFGRYFVSWHVLPVLYALALALTVWAGCALYQAQRNAGLGGGQN